MKQAATKMKNEKRKTKRKSNERNEKRKREEERKMRIQRAAEKLNTPISIRNNCGYWLLSNNR